MISMIMRVTRNIASFGLRVPDELKEDVQDRANKNGRSFNSEILQILFETVYLEAQPDGWLERLVAIANAQFKFQRKQKL